jgi:DMSO/TMAO reductase YedYZ molybdopterin-dependent catalytic subunit
MDRRRFIAIAGGAGAGILLPYSFYRFVSRGLNRIHVGVEDYLTAGPEAALRAITPTEAFYVTSAGAEPKVDAAKWSLTIDGLVERPLRFSYDELRRLPEHRTHLTLECISNAVGGRAIGNAAWRGTLLAPLLERAGVRREARYAVCYAADGFSSGHPLERIVRPDNFLAWEMNGAPLTRAHGFPLRILLPGKYGMKMPKWLTRIEMVDREYLGYWERRGWSNDAERQLRAVVDRPLDGARLEGGTFVITGYAVAGAAGVRRVELSTDGGRAWRDAEIFSNPIPAQVWALWKFVWVNAPKGKHTLRVRATDGAGQMQTARSSGAFPDGSTGWHEIDVTVA